MYKKRSFSTLKHGRNTRSLWSENNLRTTQKHRSDIINRRPMI